MEKTLGIDRYPACPRFFINFHQPAILVLAVRFEKDPDPS
jgi:hypothetical protein